MRRPAHDPRLRVLTIAFVLAMLTLHARILDAQTLQTVEGTLSVVWGDPSPDSVGGGIVYMLTSDDGRVIQLDAADRSGEVMQYSGQRVSVTARQTTEQLAVVDPLAESTMVVESIRLLQLPPPAGAVEAVSGTRKVIFLLVKFADDAAVPHVPSFYTDMTNPDTPPAGATFPTTINGFFKRTSWNTFSWVADVGGVGGVGAPGGWLTLSQPKSFYAPCGSGSTCFSTSALSNEATALGRAQGIDFKVYDNINFVLSNDLDCCAWGGSYFSSVDSKSYGATWEPPWGQNVGTYAHEMGHSLGLPHSGWVYFSYDSPWDVMSAVLSASSMTCGSYFSRNSNSNRNLTCTEPGDGYIAAHKDYLAWIPPANLVTTNSYSSTTVTLESSSVVLGAAAKMIKICLPGYACTGASARYFTVEARTKGLGPTTQFDNAIPGEGIIVHDIQFGRPAIGGSCYFNSQSGFAVPVDATPGDYDTATCSSGGRLYPNYALNNAQLTPGMSYTNTKYAFRVSVVSRAGTTYVVSVSSTLTRPITVTRADFDNDGRAEVSVFRPSNANWFVRRSSNGYSTSGYLNYQWGAAGDVPMPEDFDGDGVSDLAVYRPSTGQWLIRYSTQAYATATAGSFQWGLGGDTPLLADFDGDRVADLTVYRPSTGEWFIRFSSTGYSISLGGWFQWGLIGDTPQVGDYDGDGRSDVAVYRPTTGEWFLRLSSVGWNPALGAWFQWGLTGDLPQPADFDGDRRTDIAVYRPSTGEWYLLLSTSGYSPAGGAWFQWGLVGDQPMLADFDGDGRIDISVYRPTTGEWYIRNSSLGYVVGAGDWYFQWGLGGDTPLPPK